jgi:uncharacterized protein YidB (DUF937 family)
MDLGALMKLASNPQVRNLVMSLIGSMGGSKQSNGAKMAGLVGDLQDKGLGDQVNSWVGTGQNKPVTGQEITKALGPETIAHAAQDAGMTPQQASEELAKVLPQVVDTATPSGQPPQANDFDALFKKLMSQ